MNKSKRNVTKKNNQYNYFEFPRSVPLPKFRIPKDLITVVIKNLKPFHDMTKTSMEYMNILKILKNKRLDVGEKNHLQILKLLLYVEEVQNNEDMKIYDQHNKNIIRISKSKQYFKIFIDGLMENRPSVRFNDIVEVYDLKSCTLNLLIVINVMNDHIIAVANNQFCIGYKPEKVYNIRFRFSNYSLRCCHYALYLIKLFELTPYFFPTKRVTHINETQNRLWFNEEIENNPEQKQAVLNILCKSSFPSPYILYGPPGTGKTATLIEAICQVWQNDPSIHILVCTPSNSAADLITERLLKYIDEKNLYRMYSSSKNVSEIYDGIVNCSNYVDGQIMMLPKHLVIVKSIIICTLCACTRLLFLGLREKHFSYIFIDEAGQATEPEAMIPFNLLSSVREGRIGRLHGQVILAGDPHQLGPGIRSKIAEPILGKSLFERLLTCEAYQKNEHNNYNSNYVTKLVRNYRSHPSIIQVSNELFYDNELKACGNENVRNAEGWAHLKNPKLPIVFHGIIGDERKHFNSPSVYNIDEIKVIIGYLKLLVGQRMKNHIVKENDIGIITPFSAQRMEIHKALDENNYNKIEIGTIELFQGQEKEIIIISTVRTRTFFQDQRYHIGFLSNPKRFNVALTRAKSLLIIIGNPLVLQTDFYWRYLINFCIENNAYRGVTCSLQDTLKTSVHEDRDTCVLTSTLNSAVLDMLKLDDGEIENPEPLIID